MKILAWYTVLLMGWMTIFFLGDILDGNGAASQSLFAMVLVTPPLVFGIKFLLKK